MNSYYVLTECGVVIGKYASEKQAMYAATIECAVMRLRTGNVLASGYAIERRVDDEAAPVPSSAGLA